MAALQLFSAEIAEISQNDVFRISTSSMASEPKSIWKFELKNKDPRPIEVTLINGDNILLDQFTIKASVGNEDGVVRISNIKLDKAIAILIIQKERSSGFVSTDELGIIRDVIVPESHFSYEINSNNKTVYVSFDFGILRPQGGWVLPDGNYITTSGLEISGSTNVTQEGIKTISVASFNQIKEKALQKLNEQLAIIPLR